MNHNRTYHVYVVHGRGVAHHGQPFLGFCGHHKLAVSVALTVSCGGGHHDYFPISGIMEIQARRASFGDVFLIRLMEDKPVIGLAVIGDRIFLRGVGHGEDFCYPLPIELYQPVSREGYHVSHVHHSRIAVYLRGPRRLKDFCQQPWVSEHVDGGSYVGENPVGVN